jgi:hypothetical protein
MNDPRRGSGLEKGMKEEKEDAHTAHTLQTVIKRVQSASVPSPNLNERLTGGGKVDLREQEMSDDEAGGEKRKTTDNCELVSFGGKESVELVEALKGSYSRHGRM